MKTFTILARVQFIEKSEFTRNKNKETLVEKEAIAISTLSHIVALLVGMVVLRTITL